MSEYTMIALFTLLLSLMVIVLNDFRADIKALTARVERLEAARP